MTPPNIYDVLIVEDEAIIAETLKTMLETIGHRCIGIKSSIDEARLAIDTHKFDLAILDINIAGDHEGIELGKRCNELNKPFMFLTSYSDTETILMAKDSKPGAYIIKPFTQQEIFANIEITMLNQSNGNFIISDMDSITDHLSLSEREEEVLKCLCEKMSNVEISERLYVSTNTVKFHLKNLYVKLNIGGRSDLENKLLDISSKLKSSL